MLSRGQKIFFGTLVLIAIGIMIVFLSFAKEQQTTRSVSLTVWGVEDNSSDLEQSINGFQTYLSSLPQYAYTTVKVQYQKWAKNEIENLIVNEMAEGGGPDIFYIHNTWLPKHIGKLIPAPADVMTSEEFEKTFFQVASDDFVRDGKIYAMPHYIDTLALYYNSGQYQGTEGLSKSRPADTWDGIGDDIRQLTIKSGVASGIERAGIALGTANISSATDIVYLMMLENNVQFCQNNCTSVNLYENGDPEGSLNDYLSFASPENPNYAWNDDLLDTYSLYNDVDAFVKGKVSMIFGYSDLFQEIETRAKDTRLRFDVTSAPQTVEAIRNNNKVAFANYWAPAVSRNSANPDVAWQFIRFMTSKENVNYYHTLTNRPSSREDLFLLHTSGEDTDPVKKMSKIFARQAKYARSLEMYDKAFNDQVLMEVITKSSKKLLSVQDAIGQLNQRIKEVLDARQALTESKVTLNQPSES